MRTHFLWIIVLLITSAGLQAQFSVTYPVNYMVVQRDNNNQATVQVAGSCSQVLDSIQVRAIPRKTGQGIGIAWQRLQTIPLNGQFTGSLAITGGWYRLEVRGFRNGTAIVTDSVTRFGVGEVFAIVGHSNAQGSSCMIEGQDYCPTSAGATDERVICVGLDQSTPVFQQYLNTVNTNLLPGLAFSTLTTLGGISPFAQVAWFWGKMGDHLTERLNVPVLFYNGSFGGSNVEQNYKSANDIPFTHGFIRYDLRMPYANLRNIMNLYVPSTGVRAVLLHHGENDRGTSTADIIQYHYGLIDHTRTEFNMPELAWIVARSSFVGGIFDNVRQAQNAVISREDYNTYAGPDIDQITSLLERPDGLHFSPIGQQTAAQLWANAITETLLSRITPYLASQQPMATIACGAGNTLALSLTPDQIDYRWNTSDSTQSLTVASGRYAARQRDAKNRITFPPAITVPTSVRPLQPSITASGQLMACIPGALLLTSSYSGPNRWNKGQLTQQIAIHDSGAYNVQAMHPVYGCLSIPSVAKTVVAGRTNLSLSLQTNSRIAAVGNEVVFYLTVQNHGPCATSGVSWTNQLPPQLTPLALPASITAVGSLLTGTIQNLAANSTYSIGYTLRPTAAGYYLNSAQISRAPLPDPNSLPDSGTGDGEDDMAQADFRTRESATGQFISPNPNQRSLPPVQSNQPLPNPTKADVSLVLQSNTRVAKKGQTITISISVSNHGGLPATNLRIQSIFPDGITLDLGEVSGPSTPFGQTIENINPGETQVLTLTAIVDSTSAAGQYTITAQLVAVDQLDPDSTPDNGTTNGEDDTSQTDIRVID